MIEEFSVVLLFLPGVALLYLIDQWKKLGLSKIEIILAGSVLWNYANVIPSLILGRFFSNANALFAPLNIVGLALLVGSGLVALGKAFRSSYKIRHCSKWIIPTLLVAVLLVIVFLVTLYHPLYYEWDAVSIYLISGKSVFLTGDFYDIFKIGYMSYLGSPVMSVLFAWGWFMDYIPRLLPFVYLLLTSITVYYLGRRFTDSKTGLLAMVLTFLTFPVTIRTSAVSGLYADIPYLFYWIISIAFVVSFFSSEKRRYTLLLFSFMAATLCTLTKDTGALLLPFLFGLLFLYKAKNVKFKLTVFLFLATSVFDFFIIWNFFFYPSSSPSYLTRTVFPLLSIGVLALMVVPFAFFHIRGPGNQDLVSIKKAVAASLPILPLILVVAWDLVTIGLFMSFGSGVNGNYQQLNILAAQLRKPDALGVEASIQRGIVYFFRWDSFFLSLGLGAVFFIPLAYGLQKTGRDIRSKASFILVSSFVLSIMIWSFFFFTGYEGTQTKRLLYFAPYAAIFVGVGLAAICKHYRLVEKYAFQAFAVFIMLAWMVVWKFYFSGTFIENVISNQNIGLIDSRGFLFFASLFVVLMGLVYLASHKSQYEAKFSKLKNPAKIAKAGWFVTILLISVMFVSIIYVPLVGYINKNGWSPSYYSETISYSYSPIFEVADYYRSNITDSFITLGFRLHYLPFYANRSMIDLTTLSEHDQTHVPFAHLLVSNDSKSVISGLER